MSNVIPFKGRTAPRYAVVYHPAAHTLNHTTLASHRFAVAHTTAYAKLQAEAMFPDDKMGLDHLYGLSIHDILTDEFVSVWIRGSGWLDLAQLPIDDTIPH